MAGACLLLILLQCCLLGMVKGGLSISTESNHRTDSEHYEYRNITETDIRVVIMDVVEKIDPKFIPTFDHSKPLNVDVEFSLLSMTNFDELAGEIDIVATMTVSWSASNLPRWNSAWLNGKDTYAVGADDIWTPRLLLLNPAKTVTDLSKYSDRVRITNNGSAYWSIITGIESACSVNVVNFPFDRQTCTINIALWGYESGELTVTGHLMGTELSFVENSAWALNEVTVEGVNSQTTPFLQVSLYIDRFHAYFLINILLPPILLSIISPGVFMLPAASGERMSFAVTCFLAFGVFMGLLSDNMPKSSVPVAHLSYFMMYMLIHSCAVTACTIITLRVYNKDMTPDKVPSWLQSFVRLIRCTKCRKQCCSRKPDRETPVEKFDIADVMSRRGTLGITELEAVRRLYRASSTKKLGGNDDGEPEVTWYMVGRTLDFMFFTAFLGWMLFTIITSFMALQVNQ